MSKSKPRIKTIHARVTDEEYAIIEKKANSLGLAVSNYLRMVCLHAKIDVSLQFQNKKHDNGGSYD